MVDEAAKHSEDDRKAKEKIEARNNLDSHVHQVNKTIKEENVSQKLSEEDRRSVESAVTEAKNWLEKNVNAEVDEIEHQKQEFERKVNPIMNKLYQGGQGAGGMPGAQSGGFPPGGMPGEHPSSSTSSASGPKVEEVD